MQLFRAFKRNRVYMMIPFILVIVFLSLFMFFSKMAAPLAPFVYSLF